MRHIFVASLTLFLYHITRMGISVFFFSMDCGTNFDFSSFNPNELLPLAVQPFSSRGPESYLHMPPPSFPQSNTYGGPNQVSFMYQKLLTLHPIHSRSHICSKNYQDTRSTVVCSNESCSKSAQSVISQSIFKLHIFSLRNSDRYSMTFRSLFEQISGRVGTATVTSSVKT